MKGSACAREAYTHTHTPKISAQIPSMRSCRPRSSWRVSCRVVFPGCAPGVCLALRVRHTRTRPHARMGERHTPWLSVSPKACPETSARIQMDDYGVCRCMPPQTTKKREAACERAHAHTPMPNSRTHSQRKERGRDAPGATPSATPTPHSASTRTRHTASHAVDTRNSYFWWLHRHRANFAQPAGE